MAEQTVMWLVNGQQVRVDGDTHRVVADLNAGRGNFVELKSGDESLYVHPAHITHFMAAGDWEGPLVDIVP
jgi:hypothetical protein